MQVGYLGPHGTFSEEAAFRYFSGVEVSFVTYASIADVLEAVQREDLHKGVVPIENSIEGSITTALDGLLLQDELFVEGEIVLSISQNLLTLPGVKEEDVKTVWSIPAALAQCRRYIQSHQLLVRHFDSTAAAAAAVASGGGNDVAAIASSFAAHQFGLDVLVPNIQDHPANHTRFAIVRKGRKVTGRPTKTMLVLFPSVEHAGVLANMLHVFAALALNLSWIESRPTRTRLGTYQFTVDVEAGVDDERLVKAISILETFGHSVRVLGSYTSVGP